MGNLGRALAAYRGFAERGFRVIALVDHDEQRRRRGGRRDARAAHDRPRRTSWRSEGLAIGVIATPPEGAQEACDVLVAAGVRSVLNFAPVVLAVPDDVVVRSVDLSTELQILAFHGQRLAVAEAVAQ